MRPTWLLAFLLTSWLAHGQTRAITGLVLFDDLSPGYEARIWLHDTLLLGTSGANGEFEIALPANENEIRIGMIGMEDAVVSIPPNCSLIELVMLPAGLYHYKSHQKIDRIRKKSFNTMPELHAAAFAKGIFTKQAPGYTSIFQPSKPRLDEIRKSMETEQRRIKMLFRTLEIGDTVQVPFTGLHRADGTDRTKLVPWSYFTDASKASCLIAGVVMHKDREQAGYNLEIRVTDCQLCPCGTLIVYQEKEMAVGMVFRHNMRILAVIRP
jgi:hypothetical protein